MKTTTTQQALADLAASVAQLEQAATTQAARTIAELAEISRQLAAMQAGADAEPAPPHAQEDRPMKTTTIERIDALMAAIETGKAGKAAQAAAGLATPAPITLALPGETRTARRVREIISEAAGLLAELQPAGAGEAMSLLDEVGADYAWIMELEDEVDQRRHLEARARQEFWRIIYAATKELDQLRA